MTTTAPLRRASVRALSGRPTLRGHLSIMRFDHWFKQVFVLPGIAVALSDTAGNIPGGLAARLVVGFLAVSLVCSSNYVINEVLDAPSDLLHPTKSARPVPSGLVNVRLAYVQWIALMVVGVGLGFAVNAPLGFTVLALWVMGCLYNIPPARSKDVPYVDVLSESINNPLRMLAGWYMTGTTAFAPTSLLVSYWMVGCYFMAIKRYAEYNEIGDPTRAASYRLSFGYYTPERLLVSIVFYASAAMLFLGAFVMRYRLELILAFPLIAAVMSIYLGLAFKPDSPVINPEKLYRQRTLMITVGACAALMLVLLYVDIPALDTVFRPTGLNVRG
jgi:decaprenyl-phosphate phosphoribosyltransferase